MKAKTLLLGLMIAANGFAQGVIDVHSHIITPEFVSSLEKEGRLMDEGFPLPKYDVENHLKWMDEAGVQTSVLTLAAPQPSSAEVIRQANETAARIKKEHPGRFLFCAALPLTGGRAYSRSVVETSSDSARPIATLSDVTKAIEETKYALDVPGVICLFPMQSAEDSCQIRILEIYASEEVYQQHLKTPHFQKYKQGTLHMVKDLKLPTMKPLDPETMKLIFKKRDK